MVENKSNIVDKRYDGSAGLDNKGVDKPDGSAGLDNKGVDMSGEKGSYKPGAKGADKPGCKGADNPDTLRVLNQQVNWENMYFYQKADVIYQLSFAFCERFIHLYKDRTRDQVIQAARSCKQNIVEGLADGVTSTEMQLKLINVARASLKELREDYEDYLKSRHLRFYVAGDERYDAMLGYCRHHNRLADYEPFFTSWSDEEMCNCALTLCHMTDKMLMSFLQKLEREFISEGGIKERMYRARTGYRQQQDARLKELEDEVVRLRGVEAQLTKLRTLEAEVTRLRGSETELTRLKDAEKLVAALQQEAAAARSECNRWKAAYEDLKRRALKAFYENKAEIERLKKIVGEEE